MSIIGLLVILALIGLVAWLLVRFVPMPAQMQTVITAAAVVIAILILLQALGLIPISLNQPVPRVR